MMYSYHHSILPSLAHWVFAAMRQGAQWWRREERQCEASFFFLFFFWFTCCARLSSWKITYWPFDVLWYFFIFLKLKAHIRTFPGIPLDFHVFCRAMFTGELAESRQTEVVIRDIDERAMELLIDFAYTSQVTTAAAVVFLMRGWKLIIFSSPSLLFECSLLFINGFALRTFCLSTYLK